MSKQANFVTVRLVPESSPGVQHGPHTQLLCVVRGLLKKIKQSVLVGDRVKIIGIDWTDGRGALKPPIPCIYPAVRREAGAKSILSYMSRDIQDPRHDKSNTGSRHKTSVPLRPVASAGGILWGFGAARGGGGGGGGYILNTPENKPCSQRISFLQCEIAPKR